MTKATEALSKCLSLPGVSTVLDVGCGNEEHAQRFRLAGKLVDTVSLKPPASFVADYLTLDLEKYDLIWCSHCLEHQRNPGLFLDKMYKDLKIGGWLCVTVPPDKPNLVGGHCTIFNEATLLYQLVLAGFDCSEVKIKRYGYNISVLVQKRPFIMPDLIMDCGDIKQLEPYLPGLTHGDIPGNIWD